jgi:two-component system KDP operon response regulator KdpE
MKLLIIEDDDQIIKAIRFAFHVGCPAMEIISTQWGQKGIELIGKESPDIVILDLGLPDMDGLDVIKQIRLFSRIPVIVLTVDSSEMTVVQALEMGANDYVTKPFRQMELIARVKSLLKWGKDTGGGDNILWGDFVFDYGRRQVTCNNRVISLTSTENEILHTLINNSPNVVPYNTLADIVWGDYYEGAIQGLKTHIYNLRKKLETNTRKPQIILSKPGVGYYAVKPNASL